MPYNFAADSFHTKKLCSRLSLQAKTDFLRKSAVLSFSDPLRGATYDDHLTLIGKRVVDFLLALIALRVIIGSKLVILLQRGPVGPKFQVEGVTPTNNSSQKTRLNVLSYGV